MGCSAAMLLIVALVSAAATCTAALPTDATQPASMRVPVPTAVGQTAPAYALAQRVLGAALAADIAFEARCTDTAAPCFTLRDGSADRGETAAVVIGGSSPVEMAAGLRYYLHNYLNMSVAWNKTGGSTVHNPSRPLPPIGAEVTVNKRAPLTYYFNVVTVSYSAVRWRIQ